MAAASQDTFEQTSEDAADRAAGQARRVAEGIRGQARAAVDDLKGQARDLAEDAKARARATADRQKDSVAEQVSSLASALRTAADDLNRREQGLGAGVFEQVAQSLEQVSEALRRRDLSEVVESVEEFARRQPVAFIGGTVAAGLALGRFMKSSGTRREDRWRAGATEGWRAGATEV
jgi:ElaB/YqjD/DUF883 family membrane-anchored ribosome-binding protein